MKSKVASLLLSILCAVSFNIMAQTYDLSCIRNAINSWQSLQGCALSSSSAIAWYGGNGYQYANLNNDIGNILQELNRNRENIDYISLADNGYYVIISKNGRKWHALGPQHFYDELNYFINNGGIRSASIDQFGHYFILGNNGTVRTDLSHWLNFYNSQKRTMGEAKSAWVYNSSTIVICFDNGVTYMGPAPITFYNKIRNIDFAPDVAQFQKCGNYVLACKNGRSEYNLNNYNPTDYVQSISCNMNAPSAPVYNYPSQTAPTSYPCGVCAQTGRCLQCNGTGVSVHASGIMARCGYCGATGVCPTCHGRGYN